MDFYLLAETRDSAREILSPIIDHLNDKFNWRAALKENAELPSEYQHSPQSLRSQEDELRRHLLEYVESWLSGGSDFDKWASEFPALHSRINEILNNVEFLILPDNAARRAKLFTVTPADSTIHPGHREAAWLFAKFITSTFYDRIGQCPQCRKYFFSIRGGAKKYCSRSCATGFTARQAVKAKRAEDKREKLKRALDALEKYETLTPKNKDWKSWVAKRAKVSKNWLTRTFERGDLVEAGETEGNSNKGEE